MERGAWKASETWKLIKNERNLLRHPDCVAFLVFLGSTALLDDVGFLQRRCS